MKDELKTGMYFHSINSGHLQIEQGMATKSFTLEYYILFIVVRGELDMLLDGARVRFAAGDIVLLPPDLKRSNDVQGDPPVILWLLFDVKSRAGIQHLNRYFQLSGSGNTKYLCVKTDLPEGMLRMFRTLDAEVNSEGISSKTMADATLLKIFVTFKRLIKEQKKKDADTKDSEEIKARWHAWDVWILASNYMKVNLGKPMDIATVAKHVHLSPQRLRKLFKDAYGISPMQYLMDMRISHARQLLLSTSMPVLSIALSVGISNPLYFSRVFKKYAGASPREFRRSGKTSGNG